MLEGQKNESKSILKLNGAYINPGVHKAIQDAILSILDLDQGSKKRVGKSGITTPVLMELHWLPIHEKINFH